MKRLSDTLTYRGIASEAVFTDPPVAVSLKLSYYYYSRQCLNANLSLLMRNNFRTNSCQGRSVSCPSYCSLFTLYMSLQNVKTLSVMRYRYSAAQALAEILREASVDNYTPCPDKNGPPKHVQITL